MDGSIAIGIDLGTTNSCVAVMRYGKIEVIANEQGYFVTPSYVAFNEYEILVGDAAKKHVDMNPENTVFDSKRLIGRKFSDPTVQEDMKHWPFTVRDVNSEPRIEITYNGEKKLLAPEEISAMILKKLKDIAESYLNEEVKDAVITVPAYFNNGQRQATKDAAEIAGLNVLGILDEPTAAAMAFNYKERFVGQRGQPNILVYDLGGGTFDVSIMNGIKNSVVASTGDTHLGGGDFDCHLVNHCVQDFKKKFKIDLQGNRRAMSRLRNACEVAKRELSSATNSQIFLFALCDGHDFSLNILRAKFEYLNSTEFKKTIDSVEAALIDAKLSKEDIDIIILAGGSTRIPMVQKTLQTFFGDKFIEKSINPDEAVAYGAAVYAAYLKGNYCAKVCGSILQDITPLSLGLDLLERNELKTRVVIPRNTPIPAQGCYSSVTVKDNQKTCTFTIRQGESRIPKLNYKLGEFIIPNLPEGPAGSINFTNRFDIDANGVLSVNSVETSTGKSNGIVIDNVSGHLRKQEVEKMIRVAKQFQLEHRLRQDADRAKVVLADECYLIMSKCMLETDRKYQKCEEILGWLEEHPRESEDSYKKRFNELATFCQ